jgi:thiamine biosynthesis lipoprotein
VLSIPRRRVRVAARLVLPAVFAALALAGGCGHEPVEIVETRPGLNTEVACRAFAPTQELCRAALDAAWKEMAECEAALDRHREKSDVWRINRDAGKFSPEVGGVTSGCIAAAKDAWQLTGGAFDPTVGPLLDLWKDAEAAGRPPADEAVAAARARVGMDKVEVLMARVQRPLGELEPMPPGAPPPTPEQLTKFLSTVGLQEGMRLDLGGIAKGYVAGRMAARMQMAGAVSGLVAAAGDVYAFGLRPRGHARGGDRRWNVGVLDPRFAGERSRYYTAVRITDQAVDTSGHYYRGFTIAGKRYSHIIDPRTGRPVDQRLVSVTVAAPEPSLSDALATAIAVLGVKDGLALVETIDGAECLLLEAAPGTVLGDDGAPPPDADLIAHRSSGFAAMEFEPEQPADAGK